MDQADDSGELASSVRAGEEAERARTASAIAAYDELIAAHWRRTRNWAAGGSYWGGPVTGGADGRAAPASDERGGADRPASERAQLVLDFDGTELRGVVRDLRHSASSDLLGRSFDGERRLRWPDRTAGVLDEVPSLCDDRGGQVAGSERSPAAVEPERASAAGAAGVAEQASAMVLWAEPERRAPQPGKELAASIDPFVFVRSCECSACQSAWAMANRGAPVAEPDDALLVCPNCAHTFRE